jgi:membrane protein YqaA with SNARE-associated domain
MDTEVKSALKRLVVSVVVIFAAIVALGFVFRTPLEHFSRVVIERFGLAGIGGGIFVADMFTFPIPPDLYLLAGSAAQADPYLVIAVGSVASILGGWGGYFIGMALSRMPRFQSIIQDDTDPTMRPLKRLGIAAVVVAALTPIPFSLICYLAGALRVRFAAFALATMARIPRMAGFYFLIDTAWGMRFV